MLYICTTLKINVMGLIEALNTEDKLTENGMVTNSTSLNYCVDMFFKIGSMRSKEASEKILVFSKAFGENPLNALKLLFWCRDVRGGSGERQTFKDILIYLAKNKPSTLKKNIHLITEYGRWDDLFVLFGTKLEKDSLELIREGLESKNGLCAKWLPRGNTKNRLAKKNAKIIRTFLDLTPKKYRKLLVSLSNTVEQNMCAKNFDTIDYSKVPSKAMSDYMKAFGKNDYDRFSEYLAALSNGDSEVKINTGAIYPYDVTKNLRFGDSNGANLQWDALPNYMEGNTERLFPVVDTSGSMGVMAGGNPNVTCLDVAISLGLYISERNIGDFKDSFITFSSRPELQVLKGTLKDRYSQLSRADWGMNTNVESVFKLILNKGKKFNLPQSDMPTMIVIFSDMEFDRAERNYDLTCQNMLKEMYNESGYELPKIVYWNLNARNDNSPVRFDEKNTALVSGFSPSLLTSLLSGGSLDPKSMMLKVINSERYSSITI